VVILKELGRWCRKSRREFTTESTEYTEIGSNPRGRGGYAGIVVGELAAAAVGEEKGAGAGAVLVNGHSGSPERLNFGFSGKPARKDRGHTLL